jgi:two-component system, cell cycle response regulator DivK
MAGERILVVDDTPVNLKLTRIILANEGFQPLTAASAEDALKLLEVCHPRLILADIQLPGMDGLELTRRVKADPETRDISVIALTAYATPADVERATQAGCDGYITKPIDTRTLGARIREFLERTAPAAAKSASFPQSVPDAELEGLRQRFIREGTERVRQLLEDVDGRFPCEEAARAVHQWTGTGGLLGYAAISRIARELEAILSERPLDNAQLREALESLSAAFHEPNRAE